MNTKIDTEIKHEVNVFRGFRKHLLTYILIISLFWLGWFASGQQLSFYSWPMYVTGAWGFILIIHLLLAYRTFSRINQQSRS